MMLVTAPVALSHDAVSASGAVMRPDRVYDEYGIDRRQVFDDYGRPLPPKVRTTSGVREAIDKAKARLDERARIEEERQARCAAVGLSPWSDEALTRFPVGEPDRWR